MYKIHNILSNDERKKLIKDVQPFLMDREQMNIHYNNTDFYPGKQTDDLLHLKPEFTSLIKKIIDKIKKEIKLDLEVRRSWVKWSNGREDQMNWHHHYRYEDVSFAAVYYPHVQIQDASLGTFRYVPPSVVIAGVYHFNDTIGQP